MRMKNADGWGGTRLLAAVAVLVMVLCAFVALVPAADAEGDNPVVTTTEITAADFLNLAQGGVITLGKDYVLTSSLTISSVLTIDLNGHLLVNDLSNGTNTISVAGGGVVTVTDSSESKTGKVDNITHARAALSIDVRGTAILNGGTFVRSQENGQDANDSGGNSYYTIINHGTLTINAGTSVMQDGHFSSMIENGWYNGSENSTAVPSVLTINGGTFSGGLNTVKNDDYGIIEINGGSFSNVTQAVFLNWNEATVNGGTFSSADRIILNGQIDDVMDVGKLTVNGGTFQSTADVPLVSWQDIRYGYGTIVVADDIYDGDIVRTHSTNAVNLNLTIGNSQYIFDEAIFDDGLAISSTGATYSLVSGAYVDGNTATVYSAADFVKYASSLYNGTDKADVDALGITTVKLGADIAMTTGVQIKSRLTVDLNGFELDTNGKNLNASLSGAVLNVNGGTLIITLATGNDSTTSGQVKLNGDNGLDTSVKGSTIVVSGEVKSSFLDTSKSGAAFVPSLNEGTIVKLDDISYTICHFTSNQDVIQYGITLNELRYDGDVKDIVDLNPQIVSFDEDWDAGNVFRMDLVADRELRDPDTYVRALIIGINFVPADPNQHNTVAAVAYYDITILKAIAAGAVTTDGWNYGETPASPEYVYIIPGLEDSSVPEGTYAEYFTKNEDGTYAKVADISKALAGTYYIKAVFPETGYAEAAESGYFEFEIGEAEIGLDFTAPEDETYNAATADGTITVTGDIAYVAGTNGNAGQYVLNLVASNNASYDVVLTIGSENVTVPAKDSIEISVEFESLNDDIEVTATAGGANKIYTVDMTSLYRVSTAGFDADASNVVADVAEEGKTLSLSDVSADTMWIVFDQKTVTPGTELRGVVYYNDEIVYEELEDDLGNKFLTTENRERAWYFSFIDEDVEMLPGVYTIKILNAADDSEIASADAYVDGMIDSGFGIDKDEVTSDIKSAAPDFARTDVIDKTLWFAWYQGAATDSTVINLYKGTDATGDVAYTEPADGVYSFGQGIHVFYASFDHQLSDLASDPIGNWYVVVKDGDSTIAEGPVKVEASPSEAKFHAGEGTYYGKDVSEIQNGVSITVDKDDNTAISVTGEVFRLDSWPEWGNGPAGYYLALRVNDSEFDWSDAVVKLGSDPENLFTRTAADGLEYYVLYLGEKLTGKVFTFIFDYDGEGKFYEPTTYTVDTSGLTASYHEPEYWIVSALEYGYEDYEYNGTYSVINDKIVSYYTTATAGEDLVNVMNDFARYMGALYRYSEGEIYQVTFMKTSYTWDSAKGLKGSNWVDSEGNTLVSAVVDYVKANGVTAISMEVRGLADPGYKAATFTYAAEISDVPFVLDYDGTEIGVMPGNTTAVISYTGTVPKGQYFAGWECDGTVYQPGDVIVPTGDMKFTVRFEPFPVEKVLDIVGAGFYVNAETAQAVLAALGSTYTGGVDDNTIFLIFEMAGYGGSTVDVQLVFGETVVITASAIGDDFTSKDGVKTWLISWENQLRDVAETTGDYTFNVLVDGEVAATKTVHVRFAEEPVTYTVTFGDDKMEGLLAGDLVNVPDVGEGYIGWNLDGVIYTPGSTYVVTGDVDFVAEPAPEAEKSLTFIGAGFYEDADIAKVVLASMGSSYTGGVDDNTMLIVFANSGYTELRGYLLLNGVEVYDEALLGEDGVRTWLFSDLNPAPGFVNGTYTIEIRSGTEVVLTKDIDVRLTPAVEPETFTVTFGDTVISGLYEGDVIYVPSYTPADGYEFVGWDLEGTVYAPGSAYTVTGDAEFTAVTKEIVPEVTEYDVYWICDGEVLDIESYSAGTYPQYHGAVEPSMTETDLYTYTFTVWKDARGVVLDENGEYKVTGTTVFIAQFEEERKPIVYGDSDVTLSSTAGGVTVYLNSENGAVKPGSVKIAYTYSYFNERRGTYAYAVAYTEAQPVTNVDGSDRIVLNFDLSELPVYAEIVKLQAVYTMEDGSTTYSDTILYTPAVISRSD